MDRSSTQPGQHRTDLQPICETHYSPPKFHTSRKAPVRSQHPPVNLLVDLKSQLNGIRLLLSPDSHPNNIFRESAIPRKGVRIGRIIVLLEQQIPPGAKLENPSEPLVFLDHCDLHIPLEDKKTATLMFKDWLKSVDHANVVYTAGSWDNTSCSSVWLVT